MTKDKPKTTEIDTGPDNTDNDVITDPSKGDDDGNDWSDEGGATPSGPAT